MYHLQSIDMINRVCVQITAYRSLVNFNIVIYQHVMQVELVDKTFNVTHFNGFTMCRSH